MTNLDLPDITAFALEGSGPAALAMSTEQTLTLPATPRSQRLEGGLWATAKLGAARDAKAWPLHVGIGACASEGATLTF